MCPAVSNAYRLATKTGLFLVACFVLLAVAPLAAHAQQPTKESLEQRLRSLEDQINLDVIRITEAEEQEQASLQDLKELDRAIAIRSELVETNRQLMRQVRSSRDSIATSLREMEAELSHHREEYQKRARHAYKYGRLHDVALVLAARSINQMLVRIRYLNRFADQRRERLTQLQESTRTIERRRLEIEESEQKAQELIDQYSDELDNMENLRDQRQQLISNLRKQKSSIQDELEERRQEAERQRSMIQSLISEANNRRANMPVNSVSIAANAELSSAFMANRTGLPWPSEGVVTEQFGRVVNPIYGTVTYNPGITIATVPSAEVKAVFDGEVATVQRMHEYGRVLLINHGEYSSVYGNLSLVYVSEGPVRAGQVIGRAGTEAEPKGQALYFGLYHHSKELNPEEWLRRR